MLKVKQDKSLKAFIFSGISKYPSLFTPLTFSFIYQNNDSCSKHAPGHLQIALPNHCFYKNDHKNNFSLRYHVFFLNVTLY